MRCARGPWKPARRAGLKGVGRKRAGARGAPPGSHRSPPFRRRAFFFFSPPSPLNQSITHPLEGPRSAIGVRVCVCRGVGAPARRHRGWTRAPRRERDFLGPAQSAQDASGTNKRARGHACLCERRGEGWQGMRLCAAVRVRTCGPCAVSPGRCRAGRRGGCLKSRQRKTLARTLPSVRHTPWFPLATPSAPPRFPTPEPPDPCPKTGASTMRACN